MKHLVTLLVLIVAISGALYVFLGNPGAPATPPDTNPSERATDPAAPTRLIVYYFDMGKDCTTCLNLESYTHETLETHFPEALSSGEIEWKVVDVDRPDNQHYVEEFGLYTKAVVLASIHDGNVVHAENLSRIWELVYDKAAYMAYVHEQVEEALGAMP